MSAPERSPVSVLKRAGVCLSTFTISPQSSINASIASGLSPGCSCAMLFDFPRIMSVVKGPAELSIHLVKAADLQRPACLVIGEFDALQACTYACGGTSQVACS